MTHEEKKNIKDVKVAIDYFIADLEKFNLSKLNKESVAYDLVKGLENTMIDYKNENL